MRSSQLTTSDLPRITAIHPLLTVAICALVRLGVMVRRLSGARQRSAAALAVHSGPLAVKCPGLLADEDVGIKSGLNVARRRAGPVNLLVWRYEPTVLPSLSRCDVRPSWLQVAGADNGRWRN